MHRLLIKLFWLVLFAQLVAGGSSDLARYQTSRGRDSLTASKRSVVGKPHRFKIRTVTAGINLKSPTDLAAIESAIGFLQRARKKFEDEGYEIQTLRIATQPFPEYINGRSRQEALADLKKIDEVVSARGVLLSIGSVITDDRHDAEFPSWAAQLIKETKNINFSVTVASPERGVHRQTALTAA